MATWAKHLCMTFVTGAAVLAATGTATAQFRYLGCDTPGCGFGPYVSTADPYGGYLNGAASVVSSTGQFYIDSQKAYLLKEQVRTAQMDNRRRAYDEWLYERNTRPTLNDERERTFQQELRRARNIPPETEIWAGTSLNQLLLDIQQMQGRGASGPEVLLDPDTLKQINVTVTSRGNAGLLRDAGNLRWPYALQSLPAATELCDRVNKMLAEAKQQAASGRPDAATLSDLTRSIRQLRQILLPQVNVVSFADYTEARRFLGHLDDAVTVLKSPQASNFANGTYAARGSTVQELVQHMTNNGLRFAPAVAGQESAYNALFQALLSYDVQANATAVPSELATVPSK